MEKSLQALRWCAVFLTECLKIGWSKADLDDLERLWWKHHDPKTGMILKSYKKTGQLPCKPHTISLK